MLKLISMGVLHLESRLAPAIAPCYLVTVKRFLSSKTADGVQYDFKKIDETFERSIKPRSANYSPWNRKFKGFRPNPKRYKKGIDESDSLQVCEPSTNLPEPMETFEEANFNNHTMNYIASKGWASPTPIQKQCWPVALSNRNLIAISPTGSGKTLAFLLPAIEHINQKISDDKADFQTNARNGTFTPDVLIITPTRELARQIYYVAKDVCPSISSTCIYGGPPSQYWPNTKICVGTLGRLKDLIEKQQLILDKCTYIVIDECDALTAAEQAEDVHWIVNNTPSDRQLLMFSATWKPTVESVASMICNDIARIVIGQSGQEQKQNLDEKFIICDAQEKLARLRDILVDIQSNDSRGKIIIFVNRKYTAGAITSNPIFQQFSNHMKHITGAVSQLKRNRILERFRSDDGMILVATDVAGRGLDVPKLDYVINFDMSFDITRYIHRIGRCGRQEKRGTVYNLIGMPVSPHHQVMMRSLSKYLLNKKYEMSEDLRRLLHQYNRSI